MKLIRKTSSGMTLVEIIFAFAIISTLLTLSYAAALGAWRNATAANQRTQAQYIIQQTVEAVKAYRESDDFDWSAFLGEINASQLNIALEQADGTVTTNNFSCQPAPTPPATCRFVLRSGAVDITPVGSNILVANSGTFNIEIVPIKYFTAGNPGGIDISGVPSLPNTTTAVTFVIRAHWDDANGIASNAAASTIITRPR